MGINEIVLLYANGIITLQEARKLITRPIKEVLRDND
jgi:hypothetical protein